VPYYAAISQFDDTVGELVDFVEHRGLAEETIFVFVVDNGWEPDAARFRSASGEWDHTKRSKRAPFDAGLRTPILIRWDGRARSATHEAPVSSIDILPTILAATGLAEHSDSFPGRNLWPSATGENTLDSNLAVFGEIYPGDASSLGHPELDVAHRWIRKGNLKLITTHKRGAPQSWGNYLSGDAVFDVVADPDESRNVIGSPARQPEIQALRRLLDNWWDPDRG
jgi:uncharacterized sulfatase